MYSNNYQRDSHNFALFKIVEPNIMAIEPIVRFIVNTIKFLTKQILCR